jgi:hypothetical protein
MDRAGNITPSPFPPAGDRRGPNEPGELNELGEAGDLAQRFAAAEREAAMDSQRVRDLTDLTDPTQLEVEVELDFAVEIGAWASAVPSPDGEPGFWRLVGEHPIVLLGAGVSAAWLVVEGARRAARRPDSLAFLGLPATRRQSWGERFEAGARRLQRSSGGLFEARPLAMGAAAVAVGVLAGLALPATRREDEVLGERRDELLESARQAGREALEQSRLAARGAGERVKASLRDQELTPEQLAEKVRQVGRDAVSSVHQAERDFLRGFEEGAAAEPAPARDF